MPTTATATSVAAGIVEAEAISASAGTGTGLGTGTGTDRGDTMLMMGEPDEENVAQLEMMGFDRAGESFSLSVCLLVCLSDYQSFIHNASRSSFLRVIAILQFLDISFHPISHSPKNFFFCNAYSLFYACRCLCRCPCLCLCPLLSWQRWWQRCWPQIMTWN